MYNYTYTHTYYGTYTHTYILLTHKPDNTGAYILCMHTGIYSGINVLNGTCVHTYMLVYCMLIYTCIQVSMHAYEGI